MAIVERRRVGGSERAAPRESGRPVSTVAKEQTPTPMGPRLALLVALAAAVWIGLAQLAPPPLVPATAPATVFSGERAMRDLAVVATAPRPASSPGHAAARRYVADELRRIGLEVDEQETTAVNRFVGSTAVGAGRVRNVVGRLPGRASTGAIALDGHYDGAAQGPGATDCGACVAALHETARALAAGPAPRNDVLFVFADAEEDGDLGAAAFNAEHRWAADVRVALVVEGYASGGPSVPFATSAGNGWIVGRLLAVAPRPVASSLLPGIFSLEPGSAMDLDEYTARGATGIAVSNVDFDTPAYHTARDAVGTIDPRSVQHDGDYLLAMVRDLGDRNLAALPTTEDAVFFTPLPGLVAVHYPSGWALPIAVVVSAVGALLAAVGVRRRVVSWRRALVAALQFPVGAVVAALFATLVWWGAKTLVPGYQVGFVGNYQLGLYLAALSCIAVGLAAGRDAALRARLGAADLAVGGAVTWTVLALATARWAPFASFLFAWPLLGALPGIGWLVLGGSAARRPWSSAVVLAVAAAPGLVLVAQAATNPLAPLLARFEYMTGLPLAALPTLLVALLVGLLAPQLAVVAGEADTSARPGRWRWVLPLAAVAAGTALIAWGVATSGFDATHPRPSSLAYRLDADAGTAQWLSVDRAPDAWSGARVPAAPGRTATGRILGAPAFAAPAPPVALAAPEVAVVADATDARGRTLTLRVASPRGGSRIVVEVAAEGDVQVAAVDGRAPPPNGPPAPRPRARLGVANPPTAGVEVRLRVEPAGPVELLVEDGSDGLPTVDGASVPPRPPGTVAGPGPQLVDPTIVARRYAL
jgi:hypothetical protein